MTPDLREQLRALPGVADAEVDSDDGSPSGIRVRLHPDADPDRVGAEVQQVLASHGIRSRVAGDDLAPVVNLPLAAPADLESGADSPTSDPWSPSQKPGALPGEAVETSEDLETGSVSGSETSARASLASLSYEESMDGVTVTAVATDGQRFSRKAADSTDMAVSSAIAAAVGALAEGKPQRLLWVASETVEGSEVVTVVLEKADGSRVAGAAIVRAARAFAVARATFVALRG
ncbi:MAG TPA: hypothetical protein VK960_09235 [Acidimicrobiia bacterium]|nr:hypothetical protein [Acidimicrobiia bacterium]